MNVQNAFQECTYEFSALSALDLSPGSKSERRDAVFEVVLWHGLTAGLSWVAVVSGVFDEEKDTNNGRA